MHLQAFGQNPTQENLTSREILILMQAHIGKLIPLGGSNIDDELTRLPPDLVITFDQLIFRRPGVYESVDWDQCYLKSYYEKASISFAKLRDRTDEKAFASGRVVFEPATLPWSSLLRLPLGLRLPSEADLCPYPPLRLPEIQEAPLDLKMLRPFYSGSAPSSPRGHSRRHFHRLYTLVPDPLLEVLGPKYGESCWGFSFSICAKPLGLTALGFIPAP
ncbi:hypothetical protein Nepgr_023109 [Nepenthes gracilis]|uniref:Uncharacterized protein n=1 Tax=Nepenthes gracilis TaxID=150966 RepID=A0AAD3XXE9_NEPGR|nr:hypothetical protein Nepgr_023109 [Nepenthes gracilis]